MAGTKEALQQAYAGEAKAALRLQVYAERAEEEGFQLENQEFIAALLGGRQPVLSAADGLASLAVSDTSEIPRIMDRLFQRKLTVTDIDEERMARVITEFGAAHVEPELLERFVEVVNRYPGVTHNYLRRHHFNVWFTLIAESVARLEQILAEISAASGVEVLSLPAQEVFKIKVDFPALV